jgi:hypothetical protein
MTWLICCFLPLLIIWWARRKRRRGEEQKRIIRLIQTKKRKGGLTMSESINKFVGKLCLITTFGTTVEGVVESQEGNWLTVRTNEGENNTEIVNIDYISRIREYPLNKNGKKKMVFS